MSDRTSYLANWQDYKRRRLLFLLIWVTYIPGVFLLGYLLSLLFGSGTTFLVVAGIWMLAFIVSANYMTRFRCPRCRARFFAKTWYNIPLARRCVHCKLPLWSDMGS